MRFGHHRGHLTSRNAHTMSNRLTQIATRTGDDGTTGLGDGQRVSKDHLRVQAMGDVDELNSQLGVVLAEPLPDDVRELLVVVQHGVREVLAGAVADGGGGAAALQRRRHLAQRGQQVVGHVVCMAGGGCSSSGSSRRSNGNGSGIISSQHVVCGADCNDDAGGSADEVRRCFKSHGPRPGMCHTRGPSMCPGMHLPAIMRPPSRIPSSNSAPPPPWQYTARYWRCRTRRRQASTTPAA